MCRSVPQIPVFSTRILTSLMPIAGSGMSSIHSPRSALLFTNAFISTASRGIAAVSVPGEPRLDSRLRLDCRVNPRASSPHEVEARRLIEELAWIGEQIAGVVGESCEQAFVLGGRPGDRGFALDAGIARGIDEGDAEAANLVDQAERKGLLAGPDLAGGKRANLVVRGFAAGGDVVDELAIHVIDQR